MIRLAECSELRKETMKPTRTPYSNFDETLPYKTRLKPGDKVRIKPIRGCCNSTLCFWEWEVLDITRATFNTIYEDVALLKFEDQLEIISIHKLEVL